MRQRLVAGDPAHAVHGARQLEHAGGAEPGAHRPEEVGPGEVTVRRGDGRTAHQQAAVVAPERDGAAFGEQHALVDALERRRIEGGQNDAAEAAVRPGQPPRQREDGAGMALVRPRNSDMEAGARMLAMPSQIVAAGGRGAARRFGIARIRERPPGLVEHGERADADGLLGEAADIARQRRAVLAAALGESREHRVDVVEEAGGMSGERAAEIGHVVLRGGHRRVPGPRHVPDADHDDQHGAGERRHRPGAEAEGVEALSWTGAHDVTAFRGAARTTTETRDCAEQGSTPRTIHGTGQTKVNATVTRSDLALCDAKRSVRPVL